MKPLKLTSLHGYFYMEVKRVGYGKSQTTIPGGVSSSDD